MSPLAENLARQIREEVECVVTARNRIFEPHDSFLTSRYICPRKFVDSKRNKVRIKGAQRNQNKNMQNLEVGNYIQSDGTTFMTVWVNKTKARIATAEGKTVLTYRNVNPYFIIKGSDNLTDDYNVFLAHNKLSIEKLNNNPNEKDETVKITGNVSKKLEAGKKSPPRGGLAAEVQARKEREKAGNGETDTKSQDDTKDAPETKVGAKNDGLEAHELAALFPQIIGEEFAVLVADIKANRLREKITKFEGKILDGRNRALACKEAGIEPTFEKFKGTFEEAQQFVISKNIHRRHLTESQRASIAAEISNTTTAGGSHSSNLPNGKKKVTNKDAAKAMKVSESSVRKAKKLKSKSPKLAAEVREGKKTLHAAATEAGIVKEPEEKLFATDATPKSKLTPQEFEIELMALEQLLPGDAGDAFAIIATKFAQRVTALCQN